MVKKDFLLFLILISVISCKENYPSKYTLTESNEYVHFKIDNETFIPKKRINYFISKNGSEYISFQNNQMSEILIYNIKNGEIENKIKFEEEGPDGIIGGIAQFYINDFNKIYITSWEGKNIYVTDTTGVIKKKTNYSFTTDYNALISAFSNPIALVDKYIYIPQTPNRHLGERVMEDSRVGVLLDTTSNIIHLLPMKFPPLITFKDIGTSAGFGADYNYCFDGTHFIYSFHYSDQLYRTSIDHKKIELFFAKSKYIDKVEVLRSNTSDFNKVLKKTCEHASYRDIIYDKYRNVYYRFSYLQTEIEENENYLDLIHYGKKVFSIIVLNKELEIIGETLFPEYTYNPRMYFVNSNGLYISTSHYKNPSFNENILSFQKINLTKNK